MKYDKESKTMDYTNKELSHVHGGKFGKAKSEALKKKTEHPGGGHGDMGRALYFKRKKGEVRY